MKLCEVVASEMSKGAKFKKVGWQLAAHDFKAKTSPKWALLTVKFWGDFGFRLKDKSIDAQVCEQFSHPVYVYCCFSLKHRMFCKTRAKRSLYAFYFITPKDSLTRTVKLW